MKILHYSLGLPPYRAGGLTKYCMDLMHAQKKAGHEVELLWPGRMTDKETKIKKKKKKYDIVNYEIINPLPVSLLGGIKDVEAFTKPCEIEVFLDFLKEQKYDVIHLHTLMGLYKEFLEAANKMGIKVIYTSHDFFGVCPTGNFMLDDSPCEFDSECKACAWCCRNASSLKKIKIKQGLIYRTIKSISFVNKLKKVKKKHFSTVYWNKLNKSDKSFFENKNKDYIYLRNYYYAIFNLINEIHFNSSQTEKYYREFGVTTKGRVINISNLNVVDHKKEKQQGEVLQIGFLGATSKRKGFLLLLEALDELNEQFKDKFKVHIFFKNETTRDYLIHHKSYTSKTIGKVMDLIDIAIVPSICAETYGFNVPESLSYGVPVIVSNYVGAKDIIDNNKSGIIFGKTKEELKKCLIELLNDKDKIVEMNRYIVKHVEVKNMDKHEKEIIQLYQS